MLTHLEEADLDALLGVLHEENYQAGSTVFRAGDPGDTFFVVVQGRLQAWSGGAEGGLVGEFSAGDVVGERAVILNEPRSLTVQAVDDSTLLVVPREVFEKYLAEDPPTRRYMEQVLRERRVRTISTNPLCSLLGQDELVELEKDLEERFVERGHVVFSLGDPPDALYFVLSGELEVLGAKGGQSLGLLGPPNSFGETGLLLQRPRSATVRAVSDARLLLLRHEPFERFFLHNPKALEYFKEIRDNRTIQTLEQIPLFSYLSREELAAARGLFTEFRVPKDEIIFSAGDEGTAFFVVRTGEVEVWGGKNERELLNTIGPSGFFGEESLMHGEPRKATVKVSKEARLLVLQKAAFERFFSQNAKALAYLAEVRHRRHSATLERIPLFRLVSAEQLAEVHSEFVEQTFRKGDVICRAGDESQIFYIVLTGELDVWSGAEPPVKIARLGTGDFFGELAVILGEKRSATVIASQRTHLLGLPKEPFTRLFLQNPRSLEYFSKIMCQRLASTVTGENVGEGTVQIAVSAAPGLKGKSTIARTLAALISRITGGRVLLVRMENSVRGQRLSGLYVHLSDVDRYAEALRRSFDTQATGPIELTLGVESGRTTEEYGARLSDLVYRLQQDFTYQILDLVSEPRELVSSVGEFADILVEVVDSAASPFPADGAQRGGGGSSALKHYPVVNLWNPQSRRMPISSCVPFVIPRQDGLGPEAVLENPRSPAAIPLWRLARKILGRTIGVALGGGAAFGLSHLGVLKVLEEHEIPVDLLVGCSIGSLVAISYASGFSIDDMIDKAHEMGRLSYVATGLDPSLFRPGLLAGDRLRGRFTPLLGAHKTFDDLLLPCRTVATDILSGELVTIGRGSLESAYRASIAVPMVLSPQVLDGRVLVDGGVADPVPAETVRHMGADRCIAVRVVPPLKKGVETAISRSLGILNLMNPMALFGLGSEMPNSLGITMNALQTLQYELGLYKVISADVSIQPDLSDFTWTDFDRSHELIERGVEAAEATLPDLKRLLRPLAR